ncbi:MAG TPA: HAMP domain-containing sensor histidine kinase [Gaiellaceae bacterium]|nr:HAMP domain-containing sensor histidine kinase [Gaiellaceae bacterium]
MPDIGSQSLKPIDLGWGILALGCLGLMVAWPSWETIPFHVIWISLTLLYGFRVWSLFTTGIVLGLVVLTTGASILVDAFEHLQLWGELFEVPLMSAMFLAMVWHARRRVQALRTIGALADERASLLEHEERLLHDVSHELRTPVTIARGHLELLGRRLGGEHRELNVAFDELERIEHIVDRVLMLARVDRPGLVRAGPIPLVPFLEDVFMRWADLAPRSWRLGSIVDVTLDADDNLLRTALDALLENAVQHTEESARIELSAHADADDVVILVADEGQGLAPGAIEHIFERFARSDSSRSRREGGAGLGLAIVAAIARAHHGSCTARPNEQAGAVFELRLPLVQAAHADNVEAAGPTPAAVLGVAAGSA